jgi:nicotinamidase-related amidase
MAAERVWDRFLTEEDKQHLAASRQHRTVNFGTRPAFLMIDLYRGVFGDEPLPLLEGIKTWPGYCGMSAWEALPHIQELLRVAREVGVPIIHITGLGDAGMPGWNEAAHRDYPVRKPTDPAAIDRKRREFDIVTELTPRPGETVLKKAAPSAFWGTPLAGQLRYLDVDTLIVAGESTSGCVRASVVEGCTHRYRMQVVEECVFDRHQTAHAMNLFDMNQKYADVIPLTSALAYLQAWKAGDLPVPGGS